MLARRRVNIVGAALAAAAFFGSAAASQAQVTPGYFNRYPNFWANRNSTAYIQYQHMARSRGWITPMQLPMNRSSRTAAVATGGFSPGVGVSMAPMIGGYGRALSPMGATRWMGNGYFGSSSAGRLGWWCPVGVSPVNWPGGFPGFPMGISAAGR